MSTMVQIRNVPEDLHRALKARAALEGVSLSDLLLNEIRQIVERPSLSELRRRLAARARVTPSVPPTIAVREERERR
jgi:plasmid stability protein